MLTFCRESTEQQQDLYAALNKFILEVCLSSNGMVQLVKMGGVEICSRYLQMEELDGDLHRVRKVASHLSFTVEGVGLLHSSGLMLRIMEQFWECVANIDSIEPITSQPHSRSRSILNVVPSLFCSPDCFSIFRHHADSMITRLVLLQSPEDDDYSNKEDDLHCIGLSIIYDICCGLDCRVHLCTTYDLPTVLLNQQQADLQRCGTDVCVIDANTLQRHALLVRLYSLGGGSERAKVDWSSSPSELITDYPPPACLLSKPCDVSTARTLHAGSKLHESIKKSASLHDLKEAAWNLFCTHDPRQDFGLCVELLNSAATILRTAEAHDDSCLSMIPVRTEEPTVQVSALTVTARCMTCALQDQTVLGHSRVAAQMVSRYFCVISSSVSQDEFEGSICGLLQMFSQTVTRKVSDSEYRPFDPMHTNSCWQEYGAGEIVAIDWFVVAVAMLTQQQGGGDVVGTLTSLSRHPASSTFWVLR